MTVALGIDTYTPTTLVEGYIDAIDKELVGIGYELDRKRMDIAVLEDRATQLRALRRRHVNALDTLTPPSTLAQLVDHHGDVVGEVDATT